MSNHFDLRPQTGNLLLAVLLCLSALVLFSGCTQTSPASPAAPVTSAAIPAESSGSPAQPAAAAPVSPSVPAVTNAAGVPGSAPSAAAAGSSGSTRKYTNLPYAFSLEYPSAWEVNDLTPKIDTPNGMPGKIDVVDFYSPSITRCNNEGHDCKLVRAQFSIDVDENPGTSDVSDYYVRDVARLSTEYPIQITKSNAQTILSNEKALRLDYQLGNDIDIKVIRVYSIINGKVYIFNFHSHYPTTILDQKTHEITMEPDMLEEYIGPMEQSLKSFTVGQGKLSAI
jgi:hypothetical protein